MSDYKIIEKDYTNLISGLRQAAVAAVQATHVYPIGGPDYRREEEAARKSTIDARKTVYADFEQLIKSYLDEGYSIGIFTNTYPVLSQVVYKTVSPQAPYIDNKLALGSMGLREGSMGLREGFKGGSRITNSSRPPRGRRLSASQPRKATSKRRSRSQK